jgi:hypothetical protein
MKTLALFVGVSVGLVGGVAQATDAVLVAPAATFAVPTVVGSFVTPAFVSPQIVQVAPQSVVVSAAVTPVVVAPRILVRQPVRNCVRAVLRR